MEKFVERKNLEHYRRLLETVTEEAERDTIRKLLAEAEAKLRRLNETPK